MYLLQGHVSLMHFWNIFGDCVHFSLCFLQFQTFLPVLTEKKRLVAFHHLSFSIFPNTLLALDMWITHIQSDSLVQNSLKCRALRSISCTFGNTSTLHYVWIDWALKQICFFGTDRRYVDWTFSTGRTSGLHLVKWWSLTTDFIYNRSVNTVSSAVKVDCCQLSQPWQV